MSIPSMRKILNGTVEELLRDIHVSAETGLSYSEVSSQRSIYGMNILESNEKEHIILRYICQFKDPLILMLLGSAALSIFVGQVRGILLIEI